VITARRMGGTERIDAFRLYAMVPNAPQAGLQTALNLFVDREDYGFVWIAYDEKAPVGVCTVTWSISLAKGSVIAFLDHLFTSPERDREETGTAMVELLKQDLRKVGIGRIDATIVANAGERTFYERLGFRPANEERVTCDL
jgi:GNAT superfamily N-acetyltransferase